MTDPLNRKNQIIACLRDNINSNRTGDTISKEKYSKISEYLDTVETLCHELCGKNKLYCERIKSTNNILLYDPSTNERKKYNIICSDIVTFSGTIGITEVERDGGITAHLKYLDMFIDNKGLSFIKPTYDIDSSKETQVIDLYKDLYSSLKEYLESSPIGLYGLMSGIKTAYSLPGQGIIITPDNYEFVELSDLTTVSLINNARKFTYEVSDNVPNLKIYYEGTKLMHLRTKTDYKNKKFKLRFMIETGKNFFKIFEDLKEK